MKFKPNQMKYLKPIQSLTPESIYLIERAIMHLEVYIEVIPHKASAELVEELKEFVKEIKTE
jgi:hypothetical protein